MKSSHADMHPESESRGPRPPAAPRGDNPVDDQPWLARFRALATAANALVVTTAPDGHFTEQQPAWEDFTGQKFDEYTRAGAFDAIHPDDRDFVGKAWYEAMQTGDPFKLEFRLWHARSGSYRYVASRSAPVRDSGGGIQEWIGVLTDLTERWQSELLVQDSEERFRTVFNLARVGIVETSFTDRRYVLANKRFCEITGYTMEDLRSLKYLDITHPEDAERSRLLFEELRTGQRDSYQIVKRYITKSGQPVWVEAHVSMVRNTAGLPERAIAVVHDIGDRVAAETERDRLAGMLGQLLESISDGFLAVDRNGIVRFANSAGLRMLGKEIREVEGRRLQEICPETMGTALEGAVLSVARSRTPVHIRNYFHPGLQKYFHGSVVPGPDGGVAMYFLDVTDLRTAELALQVSEQRYRSLVQATASVVWTAAANGEFVEPQPSWEAYTAQRWPDYAGLRWMEAIHPDDSAAIAAEWQAALEKAVQHECQGRLWHDATRSWRRHSARIIPVRDPDGTVREWIGACTDIEEQMQAEASMRRLAAIVESSGDAIISTDLDGLITSSNKAAENLFGYNAAELFRSPLSRLALAGQSSEIHSCLLRVSRAETVPAFETLRHRKDGSVLVVLVTVSPIRCGSGAVVGASHIYRDISERKEMENALRRANEDLEQFAWAVAHDLQEPARSLGLFSELLERKNAAQLTDEGRDLLQTIRSSATRMQHLIRDLLLYTRAVSTGKEVLRSVDAAGVLREAMLNLHTAIEESQAEIVVLGDLPHLPVYSAHMLQLFQNLIGNAIRYRGDRRPRIEISARQEHRQWIFSVRDNGIGISPEFHERIFRIFRRLHGSSVPGTGVGLAICERIVAHYGGRIWVESAEGQGATFHFTLPSHGPRF